MKKTVSFILLFCMTAGSSAGQTDNAPALQQRPEIAAGAGYGLAMAAFVFRNDLDKKNVGFDLLKQGPAFTLDYSHPVHRRLSIGPAISGQSIRVRQWVENPSSPLTQVHDLLRINIGARVLFNYLTDASWKFYFGFRASVTAWREVSGRAPLPGSGLNLSSLPSAQVLGGVRYFFGATGVGMEAALGTAPYLVQAHVAHRF